jgi:L-amino acid N-acyltransferase YncA
MARCACTHDAAVIRDATPDDRDSIWPFVQEIVRAGETYTWPRDLGERDARDRWMITPPGRVFVATDDGGAVVGTAKLGPNFDGGGSHVANASFMVDPARGGRGIGRVLAEHVLRAATADGYRAMQFNAVVETNVAAVRLWQSLGFETLASIPGAFAHPSRGMVGLHVMYRPLPYP